MMQSQAPVREIAGKFVLPIPFVATGGNEIPRCNWPCFRQLLLYKHLSPKSAIPGACSYTVLSGAGLVWRCCFIVVFPFVTGRLCYAGGRFTQTEPTES